jgi:hypothetical protein
MATIRRIRNHEIVDTGYILLKLAMVLQETNDVLQSMTPGKETDFNQPYSDFPPHLDIRDRQSSSIESSRSHLLPCPDILR